MNGQLPADPWMRMWTLFHRALELPPHARQAFLEQECAGQNELLQQVERLLAGHEDAPAMLDSLARADDPLLGRRIDAYRLDRVVGHGGMGTVYAAEQEHPIRRTVALKLVKIGMDTAEVVARFEGERRALALMDHPNIATVHDAGATEQGRPYFVMELVHGAALDQYCDRARLTVRQRLELFLPVCHAVQHAHQKGIIHRDLKPSNILVAQVDDRPVAKVIDFGIAKAMHSDHGLATEATAHGQLIGTPAYMSPEQAAGAADVDTRTDVYSLGVILYELLVGSLPVEGTRLDLVAGEAIEQVIRRTDHPTPSGRLDRAGAQLEQLARLRGTEPRGLRRQLRGDLDWIVMRALEVERARRYATAAELAADIGRHLDHRPVHAGPPTAAYRLRKFFRRHRLGVAVSFALIIALLLGSAGTTWMAIVAGGERRAAEAARDEAREEAETALAVIRLLDQMLAAPDPMGDFAATGAAREVKVVDVLDRSAELLATLDGQPAVEATLRRTLGKTYFNLGDLGAAEQHFRRARELGVATSGPQHPDSLEASELLAGTFRRQGRLKEAEALLLPVLDTRRQLLGPTHRDTLSAMLTLANVVFEQGRHGEAEALLDTLIPLQQSTLGQDHPDTLNALNSLSLVLSRQGKHDEAQEVARSQVREARAVFGEEHPRTLLARSSLATTLEEAGALSEAELEFRTLVASYGRVLGDTHPTTLLAMQNLVTVLSRLGRHDQAVPVYRQVLAAYREVLHEDHPNVLVTAHNLARTLTEAGEPEQAVQIYDDILPRARRTLGEDHHLVATFEGGLGTSLMRLGRYSEAEQALLASCRRLDQVFGADHRRTVTARQRLVELYEGWGRPGDAARYR